MTELWTKDGVFLENSSSSVNALFSNAMFEYKTKLLKKMRDCDRNDMHRCPEILAKLDGVRELAILVRETLLACGFGESFANRFDHVASSVANREGPQDTNSEKTGEHEEPN